MRRANAGIARILEAIVAATIIFVAFTAASFFISDSKMAVAQDRTDLDRLGYNVLSKITESGTIEATIHHDAYAIDVLRGFLQSSLPSGVVFNLTISQYNPQGSSYSPVGAPISNVNDDSMSHSLAVSSTPMTYTSKSGDIYYLVLMLANPGQGEGE